ncbi:flavodoxin family protein [Streptomyces sp. NPDC093546]|uniref:flavodoxin family protein n=1 Tax=Streptomyces sp. NPDC093546 TaxID=3366040 RepID=UPI00382E4F07
MSIRVLVAFHSGSGTVAELAASVETGAREAGAVTRLRRLGPPTGGKETPGVPAVPPARVEDVLWAQVVALGTPTYFGNASSEVLWFLEQCGAAAERDVLAHKVVTAFTAASSANGGQEAVLLALHRTVAEWGALTVPTGYTDRAFRTVGGNPYGLSVTTGPAGPLDPGEAAMAGRALGRRAVALAERYVAPLATAH